MGTPTIGLFVGSTDETYENEIIRGAYEAVRDAGARIVCFNGGSLESYRGSESMRNVLYSLVDSTNVDALLISGSLTHHIGHSGIGEFCRGYPGVPIVTVGITVPEVSCVGSDNQTGMKALMDHLLDAHAYRKIAFLGGPDGQQEAEVRKRVFCEALRARGEEPRVDWMVSGDFTWQSGFEAVDRLLSDGPLKFEGIVAANDSMALGAHEALTLRGYQVPRDIFLTGYDDTEAGRFHSPALTTIRQSPYLQAREAVRIALRMLRGQGNEQTNIGSELIARASCGCFSWVPVEALAAEPGAVARVEEFWRVHLQEAFERALTSGVDREFFVEVESLLELGPLSDAASEWETTLGVVRSGVLSGLQDPILRHRGEGLIHSAFRLVSEHALRTEIQERLRSETLAGRVIGFGEALVTAHTRQDLLTTLSRTLPGLGYRGTWLSLYEDPMVPDHGLILQLASEPGSGEGAFVPYTTFPTRHLVPGGLAALGPRHHILVVEALYSQDQNLGLLVFSTDLAGAKTSGLLRTQVGGALHGIRLLEDRQDTERQLVLNEKMAALGNLVAGVAHEINTPLGVSVSAASYLKTASSKFHRTLESGQVRKSDLEAFLAGVDEAAEILGGNLERAAGLVASFKQVAIDQASEDRRSFALKEYLEATLVSLRPQWKAMPVSVEVKGPTNLAMDSYPGAIAQIVTNLLVNALTHAFEKTEEGHIWMILEDRGDSVQFRFADNGAGISPVHLPRIWEPFFTTRRGQGGTGLGLHIVYNLVTQVLGGTIGCASEVGHGTVFTMMIPRSAPEWLEPLE